MDEFAAYARGERVAAVGFLDHLCHPASLMLYLLGMPRTLYYERSAAGAGVAIFRFDRAPWRRCSSRTGRPRSRAAWSGRSSSPPRGRHIVVENNLRVSYHRGPARPGARATGPRRATTPARRRRTTAVWEPEFSLGQLYNKGLFLLGYYGEVNEFARSILEERPPAKGTLEQAWQVTRIFEAFAEGPGRAIAL